MTAPAVRLPHAPASGQRVGQGTEIEKSRASSEVYFRIAAAKEFPRDEQLAYEQMRVACTNLDFARKAFYAVPKSGEKQVGPSVHLARELARIWQNMDCGVVELRRDDEFGQSEIQAYAWDLQTLGRSAQIFIQPHKRDLSGGKSKRLTSNQDIYESNASAGARRLRECIFAMLPAEFRDEAQALCRQRIEQGDGQDVAERARTAIAAFRRGRVSEEQLVRRVGKPVAEWTAGDIADLEVLFRSLQAKEVTVEQEFPPDTVSTDEIARQAAGRKAPERPAAEEKPDERPDDEYYEQLQQEHEAAEAAGEGQ